MNSSQILWDIKKQQSPAFADYWKRRQYQVIPPALLEHNSVWLEIGAGSGHFFGEMAARHPDIQMIAIERCRERGKRLVGRAKRLGLSNFHGVRGNAIPAVITGIPSASLDRIFILYPPPWLRPGQRKNRWYLHPMMPHLVRVLKPGGLLIWASDQKFYIDEAEFVCRTQFSLQSLAHGPISPNPYNGLAEFPEGRTKFEKTFLQDTKPCYELISKLVK